MLAHFDKPPFWYIQYLTRHELVFSFESTAGVCPWSLASMRFKASDVDIWPCVLVENNACSADHTIKQAKGLALLYLQPTRGSPEGVGPCCGDRTRE
jgi:hypothetical protein